MQDLDYLNEIISNSVETILEEVFVNRYLPLIFNKDPQIFNLTWLNEVAKNPHVRVHVINRAKEVLYTVPPLRVSPLSNANSNLSKQLSFIRAIGNTSAVRAQLMLDNNLSNIVKIDSNYPEEYKKEWQAIFDRYNLTDKYVKDNNSNLNIVEFIDEDEW